ncbi:hypothetical protein J4456_00620 [Candidatus Pacearchaeota archaeon]|nr:hypothetical protein [Candidatus Pacearchaeota archaeon]
MKTVYHLTIIIVLLLLISSVHSEKITGSIGNARMILKATQGDVINKCVLVKNVNDIDLEIMVSASGDLADYVTFKEEKFLLTAGDEKKACFEITAKKSGTTETKINVKFAPEDGNGVGLSSTIIIVAEKNNLLPDFFGDDEETIVENSEETDDRVTKTGIVPIKKKSFNLVIVSALITTFLVVVLLILLGFTINKNPVISDKKIKKEQTKQKKEMLTNE